jgi:hypothetical protein
VLLCIAFARTGWLRRPQHQHLLLAASNTGRAALFEVDLAASATTRALKTADRSDSKATAIRYDTGTDTVDSPSASASASVSASVSGLSPTTASGTTCNAATTATAAPSAVTKLRTYRELTQNMTSVHINCDDSLIVASGYTKSINVYDLESGKLARRYQDVHSGHGMTALSSWHPIAQV